MRRDLVIAILVSILLHGGLALTGLLPKAAPAKPAKAEEVPTIELTLPPPPEPEEPEIVENTVSDAPQETASLAPPMQADSISAVIDSPFVQQIQAPPPPGLSTSVGAITIPTGRPVTGSGGSKLTNVFDLSALDKHPVPTFQARPPYPFEMKRAGINGEVLVRFIVDAKGNVLDPVIVRSTNPAFEETVLTTVLKWRFRPGQKGGANVNTRNVQILIPFKLSTE